ARLQEFQHLIRALERSGELNRALEFLPSDDELTERRKSGVGLTRPELAILLAYSKIWLNKHLLASNVPEDPYLSLELERYFPAAVRERFPRAIAPHRLRRATYWRLSSRSSGLQVDAAVGEFRDGVHELDAEIAQVLTGAELARFDENRTHYSQAGLSPPLAARVASLDALNAALDIVEIA